MKRAAGRRHGAGNRALRLQLCRFWCFLCCSLSHYQVKQRSSYEGATLSFIHKAAIAPYRLYRWALSLCCARLSKRNRRVSRYEYQSLDIIRAFRDTHHKYGRHYTEEHIYALCMANISNLIGMRRRCEAWLSRSPSLTASRGCWANLKESRTGTNGGDKLSVNIETRRRDIALSSKQNIMKGFSRGMKRPHISAWAFNVPMTIHQIQNVGWLSVMPY